MRRSRFALVAMLAVVGTTSGCGYNRLQTLDEQVNTAQGQIKVQLERRASLIGNLVETVKGVAKQEQAVYVGVAEARSRLNTAVQGGDVAQMGQANAALTGALGRLIAVQEAYPELKSNQNFTALQDELAGTENRIAVSRQDYNNAVKEFNTSIRRFPGNITAKMFGLGKPRPYFETTTPGAENAPKVNFN